MIDEVIYTPYVYEPALPSSLSERTRDRPNSHIQSPQNRTADLLGVPELAPPDRREGGEADAGGDAKNEVKTKRKKGKFLHVEPPTQAEIFMFEYGTVVIWGMTEAQEKRFLSSMCVPPPIPLQSCIWEI